MQKHSAGFFFASVVAILTGCGAPYQYVTKAVPSPFVRPGCKILLEPVHSEQLIVGEKPEAQYLAEKKADSADSYDRDKAESSAIFQSRVAGAHPQLFGPGAPDNTFIIRPVWTHWEPGFYAVVAAHPGVAQVTVDVLTQAGQPLERILIERRYGDFSAGGRMRGAFKQVANALNDYIDDNWICAH